ncbi:conserved hypothetical protein [Ricinus communis]|uniref:Uncharacterized protein n=1 Tax=Ricinus communis TaxID=3988 RepID=B9STS9_RICCO|nr:conserved hypothetical protein [Ricinus communis]
MENSLEENLPLLSNEDRPTMKVKFHSNINMENSCMDSDQNIEHQQDMDMEDNALKTYKESLLVNPDEMYFDIIFYIEFKVIL